MDREGPYHKMVEAFNEITELISKGTIKRKSKGKSLDDFQDEAIKAFLTSVRHLIGQILAIVNQGRNGDSEFVWIGPHDMSQIDSLKRKIVDLSNEIAQQYGISKQLQMI
jgi:hypothetical protein